MKANFNHGKWRTVLRNTEGVCCLIFGLMSACFLSAAASAKVVITMDPGSDGQAIQAALDCLPDAGGEVVLPAGTFEVRQPLVLRRDSQTLRGAGQTTVLRLADDANCPVIIMGDPVNEPARTIR